MPIRPIRLFPVLVVAACAGAVACAGGSRSVEAPVSPAASTNADPTLADASTASNPLGDPLTGVPASSSSRLQITDILVGTDRGAQNGDEVEVDYVGTLENGDQFDSSRGRGPFKVRLGSGMVIRGWEEGLLGMRAGGKRRLVIPPELGYGAKGSPPVIPPNATLVFEVTMIRIR